MGFVLEPEEERPRLSRLLGTRARDPQGSPAAPGRAGATAQGSGAPNTEQLLQLQGHHSTALL